MPPRLRLTPALGGLPPARRIALRYHATGTRQNCWRCRAGQVGIKLPPIEPDLFRLIDGTDQQTDANGKQLHIRQRDTHVARDDQSLVQHAIKDIDQICCSRDRWYSFHRLGSRKYVVSRNDSPVVESAS